MRNVAVWRESQASDARHAADASEFGKPRVPVVKLCTMFNESLIVSRSEVGCAWRCPMVVKPMVKNGKLQLLLHSVAAFNFSRSIIGAVFDPSYHAVCSVELPENFYNSEPI